MIRFIDLRHHLDDISAQFAWWDTITDKFLEYDGNMAWWCWNNFEHDYHIAKREQDYDLERFKSLCPQWVFELPETPDQ